MFQDLLTRTTVPEDVHPKHRRPKEQATEQDSKQHSSGSCPLSPPFSGKPLTWRTLVGEGRTERKTNETNLGGTEIAR